MRVAAAHLQGAACLRRRGNTSESTNCPGLQASHRLVESPIFQDTGMPPKETIEPAVQSIPGEYPEPRPRPADKKSAGTQACPCGFNRSGHHYAPN